MGKYTVMFVHPMSDNADGELAELLELLNSGYEIVAATSAEYKTTYILKGGES